MASTLLHFYLPCLSFCKKHVRLLLSLCFIAAIAFGYALSFPALRVFTFILVGLFAICGVGRLFKRYPTVFLLVPLLISLALSLSLVHRLPAMRLSAYFGKIGSATLRITDVLEKEENLLSARASLLSLGEKEISATVLLYLQTNESFTEGDLLRVTVRELSAAPDTAIAEGIDGKISAHNGTKIGERHSLSSLFAHYNSLLSSSLQERIQGEAGAFLAALVLGDKSGVSPSLSHDMARNGTSHILALSGLHVSLFMSGVSLLLRPLHKKARILISLLMITGYVLLTGASPSVLRAGFMCACALLSFLVGRRHSSIFSLFVSLCLIFIFEPYSVNSVSLWLSALATLGILLYYERRTEKQEKEEAKAPRPRLWKRALAFLKEYVVLSAVITAAASLLVLPLSSRVFGTLSILSIPANLLLAPFSNLLLYGAFLLFPFGRLAPFSFLLERMTALFLYLSARLADIPHTQISFSNPISLLAAAFIPSAILFYCIFTPKKRFKSRRVLSLCLALVFTLSAVHVGDFLLHKNGVRLDFAANTRTNNDAICLRESTKTFVIDGSLFSAQSIKHTLSLAGACARQEIDAYVITCYDGNLSTLLRTLTEENTVREVLLPTPVTTEERLAASTLSRATAPANAKVTFYRVGETLHLGRVDLSLLFRMAQGGAETAVAYGLQIGQRSILCASSAVLSAGTAYARMLSFLADFDTLLLGSYGEKKILRPLPSSAFDKEVWCASEAALGDSFAHLATARVKRGFFAPVLSGPLFSKP